MQVTISSNMDKDSKLIFEAYANSGDEGNEACPGCGCQPGDGLTEGCEDPNGCGYWRDMEARENQHGNSKGKQTLPNGSKIVFHLKDVSPREFPNVSSNDLEAFEGQQATIQELATATELGQKDFEYYDIVFDNGKVANAISGYHLDPVNTKMDQQATKLGNKIAGVNPAGDGHTDSNGTEQYLSA